ncbi:AraC family transcriptional regulator [Breoghania sp. L-A4]|uniref:helix-turn-helix domain-containing protein n=1 Tax=Breoghania sp. L-A4 TaxID=2304600 RepID=UPI000E358A89|nr:AraC family transcriptional regulator [Breoghania sp. L-A4]AXS39991.1 AraC family transcriptional regulator [Breoghania sp. L-A4]
MGMCKIARIRKAGPGRHPVGEPTPVAASDQANAHDKNRQCIAKDEMGLVAAGVYAISGTNTVSGAAPVFCVRNTMENWLHEPSTPILMQKERKITVESAEMTITARVDNFSRSNMFWVDGSVDVRNPGLMKPTLPTELLQPIVFIPLTFQGDANVIVADLQPHAYNASKDLRAIRLYPDSIVYDFQKVTRNRTFVPCVGVQSLADWFGGRLPKELAAFTADTVSKSIAAPIVNRSLLQMLALQIDNYAEPMRALAFESLAMQMITQFLHELCGADARNGTLSISEIRGAKEAHERLLLDLRDPPTSSALAETAGMSERRLDHAFRELYGTSIFKTLTNARLDHAYQILHTGTVSVKELSFRLGYSHASSFSRAFFLRYGVYPAQIRSS